MVDSDRLSKIIEKTQDVVLNNSERIWFMAARIKDDHLYMLCMINSEDVVKAKDIQKKVLEAVKPMCTVFNVPGGYSGYIKFVPKDYPMNTIMAALAKACAEVKDILIMNGEKV